MLPITLDEYKQMKAYVEEHNIKPTNWIKSEGIHIMCPFYDPDNKVCKIYEARPEVCREFICSNPLRKVDKNRRYYDKRADINGDHLDRFVPMDLLFYNNPLTAIMIAYHQLECKTPTKMLITMYNLGRDQKFLNENKEKYDIIIVGITKDGKWLLADSVDSIRDGSWRKSKVGAVISPDTSRQLLRTYDTEKVEKIKIDVVVTCWRIFLG